MPTLPLSLLPEPDEPDAIQISVEVQIGNESIRAVVDTGGGSSSFATTQTQNVDIVGSSTSMGGSGTVASDDIVVIPRLSLGSIIVRELRASRIPVGDERPSHVGMDILGRHRCHFRFTSGVLEIDEAIPPDLPSFPLAVLSSGQPMIEVRFGNHEATAVWDSGAALTAIDKAFADANPHLVEITGRSEIFDTSGARYTAETATMASCTIGGVEFPSTPCFVQDFSPINEAIDTPLKLAVGAPLMMLADWLFNFPAGTWAVTSGGERLLPGA